MVLGLRLLQQLSFGLLTRYKTFAATFIAMLFFGFQIFFFSIYSSQTPDSLQHANIYYNDREFTPTLYTSLLGKYGEEFAQLEKAERCDLYFTELEEHSPDWKISSFTDLTHIRNVRESSKEDFLNLRIKTYKEQVLKDMTEEEQNTVIEEKDIKKLFELDWDERLKTTQKTEQTMTDATTHLRVYGSCFLDHMAHLKGIQPVERLETLNRLNAACNNIEDRIFGWLNKELAVFKRWDGTEMVEFPEIWRYTDQQRQDLEEANTSPLMCYMHKFRSQLNGKGIVVSAADQHVPHLIELLASLRALGNTLPIQIVHSGDLSQEGQKNLTDAARTMDLDLSKADNLVVALKRRNLQNLRSDELAERLFVPQELWFVNIEDTIKDEFRARFGGYSNKLLAYFFNSFRDTILIDVDTVILVDLQERILGSSQYSKHGAFFFKDREIGVQISATDSEFFQKLFPTAMDEGLFDIPRSTSHTLGNRFIKGRFHHYMESGIVAVDRVRHFTAVLGTMQLNLWTPVTEKIWGDKEMFWLGFSIVGDEEYGFNNFPAGSLGTINDRHRKGEPYKLCSTHPAHLSSDDNSTLLWFNSGFSNCKKPETANHDITLPAFKDKYSTTSDLRAFFESYQKFDAIALPFAAEDPRAKGKETWLSEGTCGSIMFCAYGYKEYSSSDQSHSGKVVRFGEEVQRWHGFLGSVHQFAFEILRIEPWWKEDPETKLIGEEHKL